MSRRKQAFPVRVEGNRLHLSAESEPSCIQNSSEPTSNEILSEKCNPDIPDDVHNMSPDVSNRELIDSSVFCDEPKTDVLSVEASKTSGFVHNKQNFTENEARQQESILSSVQVVSPVALEDDSTSTSVCSDSFTINEEGCCGIKEALHTYRIDEKKQNSGGVKAQVLKSHTDHCCKGGRSPEICRDLNIRTSLVCTAGTEIKIIQNTCADKVEVHCFTDSAEITFEVHKKSQKQTGGYSDENSTPETVEQVCTVQELERKKTVSPCAEANDENSEPQTVLSCMDSTPDAKESSLSPSPTDERKQCERIISSPEPDSNTIPLDACELYIQDEGACVESSRILPVAELIVTDDIYNEPNADILADDEALPPIKVEPCIILKEEQEPLNIPSCIDTSDKAEVLGAFPDDEVKQSVGIINVQEAGSLCLLHGHASCDCKGIAKEFTICSESVVKSPLTRRVTRQSAYAEKERQQSLAEFAKSTSKADKKQLVQTIGIFHKDCSLDTEEQKHSCAGAKSILESEEPPLEAILPCVDIDLSLLKNEQEPVVISSCKSPALKESTFEPFPGGESVIKTSELKHPSLRSGTAHYGHEGTESAVEECRDINIKTRACRTRRRANWNNSTENKEEDSITKSKGNAAKAGRKRRQKTRSRRRIRAPQTKKQNRKYTQSEKSQFQVILPCGNIDPSVLEDETEMGIISACKDATTVTPGRNLFTLPGDEDKKCECKGDTLSEHKQLICQEHGEESEISEDTTTSNFESDIPENKSSRRVKPCVTDEELRCMVDFTKEALEQREKKLQQIREAVYRKRALETEEQRQARLEKDKLRQRKRRAEETEEQREKRLLTMRLHKRIKRSMNSNPGLQKNFLDYYMEEMFKYPETQEEQGSPLNMIVSIDPSWVLRTVEKQQFKCTVETEEQRRIRLEKDMLRQRKKRAEETPEQRAKRLETMRVNKRIRRAMETEEQRLRRLEYSRERQLYRRLNETDDQRKERLEREKLRQREKRASESSEERALRLRAARERMRMRISDPTKVTDMIDNLLSSDSLSS